MLGKYCTTELLSQALCQVFSFWLFVFFLHICLNHAYLYLSLTLQRGGQNSIANSLNMPEVPASNSSLKGGGKYIEIHNYNYRWLYISFQSLQPLLLGPYIRVLEIISSQWTDSINSVSLALDKFLILKFTFSNSRKTIMWNEKEVIYIYEHPYFLSFHTCVCPSSHQVWFPLAQDSFNFFSPVGIV